MVNICIYLISIHFKKSVKDPSNDAYALFLCVCFYFFWAFYFSQIFFIKVYVVGTHLNCINKSMQFKWVLTIYAFIKLIYVHWLCSEDYRIT